MGRAVGTFSLHRSIAAASRDGVAPPVLARLCGSFPAQCGTDIPVCAGLRGQAGMPAPRCTLHRCRASRDGFALPVLVRLFRSRPGTRRRRATSGRTPIAKTMSRPFRASHFSGHFPGRCPGLVCHALSGLSSALSLAPPPAKQSATHAPAKQDIRVIRSKSQSCPRHPRPPQTPAFLPS